MTEERFEEFLSETAGEYNQPPESPREDMWAAIQEARQVVPIERARRFTTTRWVRWGMGIAAALAVGIGLGRLTAPGQPETAGSEQIAADAPATAPALTTRGDAAADRKPSRAVRLATAGYLDETATFLTVFRAQSREGGIDSSTHVWARQLLNGTRLRMGSRATAGNPHLRVLLEDLELVLAQIVQLGASGVETDLDETEFIDHNLEQRQVMTRLRATLAEQSSLAKT
jgi:hypothetical protein